MCCRCASTIHAKSTVNINFKSSQHPACARAQRGVGNALGPCPKRVGASAHACGARVRNSHAVGGAAPHSDCMDTRAAVQHAVPSALEKSVHFNMHACSTLYTCSPAHVAPKAGKQHWGFSLGSGTAVQKCVVQKYGGSEIGRFRNRAVQKSVVQKLGGSESGGSYINF